MFTIISSDLVAVAAPIFILTTWQSLPLESTKRCWPYNCGININPFHRLLKITNRVKIQYKQEYKYITLLPPQIVGVPLPPAPVTLNWSTIDRDRNH